MDIINIIDNFHLYKDVLLREEHMVIGIAIYAVSIFVLKMVMGSRQPVNREIINPFLAYHNLFLMLLSMAMVVGTAWEAFKFYQVDGLWELYCSNSEMRGKLEGRFFFWMWVFYASKYYEFFDTLFIILKKKELLVLHVWHHMSIVPLCFYFLKYDLSSFSSGVIWNGSIHTFMYYLYYLFASGKKPTWSKYMTTAQLIQFVWGITSFWPFPFVCGYSLLDYTGPMFAMWINQGILLSFFLLFLAFFNKKYKKE
eukprot:TRINITY_DN13540_c0_g1_i1.p1 TRINITY_DN13540_c0_g1~~TRINITY_DN13540_c0_g1_i1.p1  ORF type:complete len:254 (+),score=51.66 TRINITY_DN13540_c0_g1_i1:44-805(+)